MTGGLAAGDDAACAQAEGHVLVGPQLGGPQEQHLVVEQGLVDEGQGAVVEGPGEVEAHHLGAQSAGQSNRLHGHLRRRPPRAVGC